MLLKILFFAVLGAFFYFLLNKVLTYFYVKKYLLKLDGLYEEKSVQISLFIEEILHIILYSIIPVIAVAMMILAVADVL